MVTPVDRMGGAVERDVRPAEPSEERLAQPMLALALAVFAGAASMRCLDALLPALAADFGRSVGSAGSAVSAYALSYSVCQLIHGPLGDRLGAFRVVAWAACLSALAAAACALAPSLAGLVALRFVAGSIAAAIGPLTLAWVSRSTSAEERPVALARMTAAAILGTAAGQVGGGVVGGVFGWPLVFIALAVLFAFAGLALTLLARERPELLKNVEHAPHPGRQPSHPLSLVRRPAVRRVLGLVAIQGFAIYLSLTYVGALLRDRLVIGPARAGLVVSLYGVGGITFVLLARRLLKVAPTGYRAAAGGVMLGVGFATLGVSGSEETAAASLFAIGFGFLMLHNVLQVMATRMAPDVLGTSLSLFAAASCLSQAIGAAAGGYIFDRAGPIVACLLSAVVLTGLGGAIAAGVRVRPSLAEEVVGCEPRGSIRG